MGDVGMEFLFSCADHEKKRKEAEKISVL